jgi:hypothetical protein
LATNESTRFARPLLARWRPLLESLALAFSIALLVTTAGICISASGTPKVNAGNAWGRVTEISGRIAVWEYPAIIALALVFVLVLRILFEWPEDLSASRARAVLVLALVNCGIVAAAAIAGMIAVFLVEFRARDLFTGVEQAGEVVYNFGILLAVATLSVLAIRGIAVVRTSVARRQPPEPLGAAPILGSDTR